LIPEMGIFRRRCGSRHGRRSGAPPLPRRPAAMRDETEWRGPAAAVPGLPGIRAANGSPAVGIASTALGHAIAWASSGSPAAEA